MCLGSTVAAMTRRAWRGAPFFPELEKLTFPFEADDARQYHQANASIQWNFSSNAQVTEVPSSARKTTAVLSTLVQGHCGVDAHPSRPADRAAGARMAARPGQHARNGYAFSRRHEQHGPKHGGHGRPHVYDPAAIKAARRSGESKGRGRRSEDNNRALQGLSQGFARWICHRESETQAASVSLHKQCQYSGGGPAFRPPQANSSALPQNSEAGIPARGCDVHGQPRSEE